MLYFIKLQKNKPVLLATGASAKSEVIQAVNVLEDKHKINFNAV